MCDLVLSEEEVSQLSEAIEENYYYEMVVDDIPVREFVGHVEETGFVPHSHKVYLWTHQHFNVYYNEDKVSCFFFIGISLMNVSGIYVE